MGVEFRYYSQQVLTIDYCIFIDEFGEKFGIARVIEALQCAKWPNMKMKGIVLMILITIKLE